MKFGKTLRRNEVLEWRPSYVNYKLLKFKIKQYLASNLSPEEIRPRIGWYLDQEVSKVELFFSKTFDAVLHRYQQSSDNSHQKSLIAICQSLIWFAEINSLAFVKILKKCDKKCGMAMQYDYLHQKVYTQPFASKDQDSPLSILHDIVTECHLNKGISQDEKLLLTESIFEEHIPVAAEHLPHVQESPATLSSGTSIFNLFSKLVFTDDIASISKAIETYPGIWNIRQIHNRSILHSIVMNWGTRRVPTGISAFKVLLSSAPQSALVIKDTALQTAVHLACRLGLDLVLDAILQVLDYNALTKDLLDDFWRDKFQMSPLHLAVTHGHVRAVEKLFQSPFTITPDDNKLDMELVHLATTAEMTNQLQLNGFDINYTNSRNQSLLHLAAERNNVKLIEYLLTLPDLDLDICETQFGWTALFVAAANLNKEVVQLLLERPSSIEIDLQGWTSYEHAAFRGNFEIAQLIMDKSGSPSHPTLDQMISQGIPSIPKNPLKECAVEISSPPSTIGSTIGSFGSMTGSIDSDSSTISGSSIPSVGTLSSIMSPRSSVSTSSSYSALPTALNWSTPKALPSNEYGKRYKPDKFTVLIMLGASDVRVNAPPVQLDESKLPDYSAAVAAGIDTKLQLIVSASKNVEGEAKSYDLPMEDSVLYSIEPVEFYATEKPSVSIFFSLVSSHSQVGRQKRIGQAVAVLNSLSNPFGELKKSLINHMSVPIVEVESLEVIGMVNFEFLIISPYHHEKMHLRAKNDLKSVPPIIGHRGFGQNLTTRKSLQVGENTLESFRAAAHVGAQYVEMDVQVTKDHVPVLYHDWCVSETGIDAPVHSMTCEQFLNLDVKRHSRVDHSPRLTRSRSVGKRHDDTFLEENQKSRMRYTRDIKVKGFKPNSLGWSVQSSLMTLEQAFKSTPKSVGFDLEMKYPMLDEFELESLESYALNINTWVDKVLDCVFEHASDRKVIFSCFNPAIAMLLVTKQPSIPVLFLTEGGNTDMADIRARSLYNAILFAKTWNLFGIVTDCTVLILCPRLAQAVKNAGLLLFTYGARNNDLEIAKKEVQFGVDGVVADSVVAISNMLAGAGLYPRS